MMYPPIECFLAERLDETWENHHEHGVSHIHYWWNPATGERYKRYQEVPPGGMWYATWLEQLDWHWKGPDGRIIQVCLPNGRIWTIDGCATNCTGVKMPDDDGHRCWARHGEPPRLTVDKVGHTCNAGAGSIQAGDYHGFLRDGVLTSC